MFKSNELERLYRDVRCGGFHPANSLLVHEIVGKTPWASTSASSPAGRELIRSASQPGSRFHCHWATINRR